VRPSRRIAIGIPEVFEVTIASGAIVSSCAKSACLGAGFSMIASRIQRQSARRPR